LGAVAKSGFKGLISDLLFYPGAIVTALGRIDPNPGAVVATLRRIDLNPRAVVAALRGIDHSGATADSDERNREGDDGEKFVHLFDVLVWVELA